LCYGDGVDGTLQVPAGAQVPHLVESVLNQYR
jgi:hypothetical protein